MFQWLRLHSSNPGGLSETPGQGTRSHMLQLRVCMPELNARIQHFATETKTKKTKVMSIRSVMPSNHLILCPSPPAFSLSQHQGLFKWVSPLHQVARVLEFQLQHVAMKIPCAEIEYSQKNELKCIKKQRYYFANKGPSSQSDGFSSSHVWMWELNYKERWVPKNWCFWTVVLEKTLENPLDSEEIKPVNPKGNQS